MRFAYEGLDDARAHGDEHGQQHGADRALKRRVELSQLGAATLLEAEEQQVQEMEHDHAQNQHYDNECCGSVPLW